VTPSDSSRAYDMIEYEIGYLLLVVVIDITIIALARCGGF